MLFAHSHEASYVLYILFDAFKIPLVILLLIILANLGIYFYINKKKE